MPLVDRRSLAVRVTLFAPRKPVAVMCIQENDTERFEMVTVVPTLIVHFGVTYYVNIAACFGHARQYVFTFSIHITDMLCALCM